MDDPADPGGATNKGVTIGTLKRLGMDLDSDGVITKSDLRKLTTSQAVDIFVVHYFDEPGIGKLPEMLQPSVFDMYVNAGSHAVTILQKLFNVMGLHIDVDGVIGPMTVAGAQQALKMAPDHLRDAYGIERRNYYYTLADRNPKLRKYARERNGGKGGWIKRAEEFISPRFHFSDAEHRERVAAWG